MTTVAAISDGKRAWIGADRCTTLGDTRSYDNDKLIRCGHFAFGCAGSAKAKNFLRACSPELKKARSIYEFAGLVHRILFRHKFKMRGNYETEDCIGHLDILVAESSNVFVLSDGVRITTPNKGVVAAIGSGCEFAVGAGNAALRGGKAKPGRDLIHFTIVEACRWDRNSGGTPQIIEVK